MKILLIHHRLPYPLYSGMDKVRYNLIRGLNTKYEVSLLVPIDEFADNEGIEIVKKICTKLITVNVKNKVVQIGQSKRLYIERLLKQVFLRIPNYINNTYYSELATKIKQETTENQYDIVQPLSDMTAGYLSFIKGNALKFLGPLDDTPSSSKTEMKVAEKLYKKISLFLEYQARKYWQPKICKQAHQVFFFSDKDMNHIKTLSKGLEHALVMPTAVEDENSWNSEAYKTIEENSIIFVGGLGPLFNQHAVWFFYNEIFPLILKQIPEAKFYIVGQSPPQKIQNLAQKRNVIVTGEVANVQAFIEKSAVYVSPLVAGSGFKTKIIEALRFGKAIVSTEVGLQGLWDLGKNVFSISNQADTFANEVIVLLKNPELRREREKNARLLFEKTYCYEAVLPKMLDIYTQLYKK